MERRVPGHRTECKLRHKEAPQGRVSVRGPEARCGDGSQEEGGPHAQSRLLLVGREPGSGSGWGSPLSSFRAVSGDLWGRGPAWRALEGSEKDKDCSSRELCHQERVEEAREGQTRGEGLLSPGERARSLSARAVRSQLPPRSCPHSSLPASHSQREPPNHTRRFSTQAGGGRCRGTACAPDLWDPPTHLPISRLGIYPERLANIRAKLGCRRQQDVT